MTRRLLEHLNHELRSPMTVIVGMTDLLLLAPGAEEQGQFLQSVKQAADGLLRMLDEAVDFSRLETGALELREGAFDLAEVVNQAQDALGEGAAALRLSVTIDASAPPRLVGDGPRLRQILVALARSAAKFRAPHEYDLRIAPGPIEGGALTLYFALGDRDRPFDVLPSDTDQGRFLTLPDFAEQGYSGSGLGLPVAAGLSELMGGRLWMADDASSPVLFRVSARFGWPDLEERPDLLAAVEKRLNDPSPDFGSLRVLLVEDTAANRQFFTSVLEQRGHTVLAVANGQEALQAFQSRPDERPFDLMLIDLEMPVMDGWQTAAALRQLDAFAVQPVPLVALTAHPTSGEACPEPFDAAITKPCDLAHFYGVIEAAASGQPGAADSRKSPEDIDQEAASEERVDYRGALGRLDGNEQLFYDLVRFVLQDAPVVLAELGSSLDRDDAHGVERAAHSLRGLMANFGAAEATRLAMELQRLGHDDDLAEALHLYQRLQTEVNLVRRELEGYQARAGRRREG